MNDKAFEKKVDRDMNKTIDDLTALGNDGITGLTRKYEHLADAAKEKATGAVKEFNKQVDYGLSQYNAKVQDVAERVPGGFAKKIAEYPWVTISLSLVLGLLLGILLKPSRQPLG